MGLSFEIQFIVNAHKSVFLYSLITSFLVQLFACQPIQPECVKEITISNIPKYEFRSVYKPNLGNNVMILKELLALEQNNTEEDLVAIGEGIYYYDSFSKIDSNLCYPIVADTFLKSSSKNGENLTLFCEIEVKATLFDKVIFETCTMTSQVKKGIPHPSMYRTRKNKKTVSIEYGTKNIFYNEIFDSLPINEPVTFLFSSTNSHYLPIKVEKYLPYFNKVIPKEEILLEEGFYLQSRDLVDTLDLTLQEFILKVQVEKIDYYYSRISKGIQGCYRSKNKAEIVRFGDRNTMKTDPYYGSHHTKLPSPLIE